MHLVISFFGLFFEELYFALKDNFILVLQLCKHECNLHSEILLILQMCNAFFSLDL